jgi:hypothetical protein
MQNWVIRYTVYTSIGRYNWNILKWNGFLQSILEVTNFDARKPKRPLTKKRTCPGFQTWPYPPEKSFSERYKQGSREFEVGSWLTPLLLAPLHDYWPPQSLQSKCRRLYCGSYTMFALPKFQRLSLAPLDGDQYLMLNIDMFWFSTCSTSRSRWWLIKLIRCFGWHLINWYIPFDVDLYSQLSNQH